MKEAVKVLFGDIFEATESLRMFFAPGRVNLIGEYTDFNGGHVLPCALEIGTFAAVSPRKDRMVRLYSSNFPDVGIVTTSLDALTFEPDHDWVNYAKGVLWALEQHGTPIPMGFDAVISGNIPNGAGLSSSASLELLVSVIANELYNLKLPTETLVDLSKKAENQFIGVNCGIMDQFAIGMGKKNHAILLNTDTMKFDAIPLNLEGYELVIANTNKRRGLADSQYNTRFKECRDALADLQTVVDIQTLCDLDVSGFEQHGKAIQDPLAYKRAKHAISENQRTLEACSVLKSGDLKRFGELMNASHLSLKEDFEVSCRELDILVQLAQSHGGVVGSRMTGAGFGGCTVSLVSKDQVSQFVKEVGAGYREKIGYDADFYVVQSGPGAGEIQ